MLDQNVALNAERYMIDHQNWEAFENERGLQNNYLNWFIAHVNQDYH